MGVGEGEHLTRLYPKFSEVRCVWLSGWPWVTCTQTVVRGDVCGYLGGRG